MSPIPTSPDVVFDFRLITPTSESLSGFSASSSSFWRIPETSVLLKAPRDNAARDEFSLSDADRLRADDLVDDDGGGGEDASTVVDVEADAEEEEEDPARAAEAALTSLLST